MTALIEANKIAIGGQQATAVYVGANKAWPFFKPSDLGANCVGWFDALDPSKVTVVGSGVQSWVNKGVGSMSMTQATAAYRPQYANGTVTTSNGQAFDVAGCPTTYDMAWIGRPKARPPNDWRTLTRNNTAGTHPIIMEYLSSTIGSYQAGYFPALSGIISPTNMTSNNTPAPFVVSDYDPYPGYPAYAAFDGNPNSHAHSALPLVNQVYCIRLDIGSAKFACQYVYQPRHDTAGTVPYQQWYAWRLYGSQDATNWTQIDDVPSVANFTVSEKRAFSIDLPGAYRFWQWNVSVGTGYDPAYAATAALELYSGYLWDNWGIGYGRFGAAPVSFSINGGGMASTGTTLAANGISIDTFGGSPGAPPGQPWGDIKEVILLPYNSESSRQKVEGYLAHRHALTSLLPAGHPYKTVRP